MSGDKIDKANTLIAKLKAHGNENDVCNLKDVYETYKNILTELPVKDKGTFSLNILCILCRNIEKVPKWREKICNSELLELSISCLRQTRELKKTEQIRTLACVYHIHKYLVRQDSTLQPSLLLKLSYMPFEVNEELLQKDHNKVYWSILADRLIYIEKIKPKRNITDLLKKINDDIKTIINIYNPVNFCSNVLTVIIKKLHFLYSDISTKELMIVFRNIFESLTTKNNIEIFKNISKDEAIDIYIKFNECLYVIIENESKISFVGSDIYFLVQKIISILGHFSDILHCYQNIYLNCFSCIFKYKTNPEYIEVVLDSLKNNCEIAEKLDYGTIMCSSYPFIAQLLRLYIEFHINNNKYWIINFNTTIQKICLNIILYLIDKLSNCRQISKCDNCTVNTGLHDALRLTFLIKNMIILSIEKNINISLIYPIYYNIVIKQYIILKQLKKLNCYNHEKCLKKIQTDIHNTAIVLNKAKFYEFSIKLFNIYIENEIYCIKNNFDVKNISRAFYNRSISQMEFMSYDEAIHDAYFSLVLSLQDGFNEKYISLVVDIKAKILKNNNNESMQLMTVLTACKNISENKDFVNLKKFITSLKFSALLRHEFSMYVKLWPSLLPIAGVWISFNELTKGEHTWLKAENEEDLLYILYEIILETPNAVRTINSDYFKNIINELLERIRDKKRKNIEEKIIEASFLFLKSEYDILKASDKYGWKQIEPLRTLLQEHKALRRALEAVDIWIEILPKLNTAQKTPSLKHSLQIAQVFVQQLLYTQRTLQALQLAHVCCELAMHVADRKAYIKNLGVILQYANKPTDRLDMIVTDAVRYWQEIISCKQDMETALVFACELAMYYENCGSTSTSEELLRYVQAQILENLDENLDLAIGRLLEAHAQAQSPDTLSKMCAAQRHYVAVTNNETTWTSRRHRSLLLRAACCSGAARAGRGARALQLWRRARSAQPRSPSAPTAADICALGLDTNAEDAEVNIDRIKHILGLQPTNEIQPQTTHKVEHHTPKHTQIETMLKSSTFRRLQSSPSSPMTSSFTLPEFYNHDNCQCYACQVPVSYIIAARTCFLEASMYFRSKDFLIARNYFEGAKTVLNMTKEKLFKVIQNTNCEKYICDIVKNAWDEEIKTIETELLIEETFLELAQKDVSNINSKLIKLEEISKETKINKYLQNDINNLLITTCRLQKVTKKKEIDTLDIEMEQLNLSPNTKLIKTPESKNIPKTTTNKVVKQNDMPSLSYKISKLNLDGEDYDEKEPIKEIKKPKFKIPEPIINKPILETITPRPKTRKTETRLKIDTNTPKTNLEIPSVLKAKSNPKTILKVGTATPVSKTILECDTSTPTQVLKTTPLPKTRVKVLLTQATQDQSTPVSKTEEFFTPSSTPAEQFFTPITSVKSYTRKKPTIVKNLENEFSTPNVEIERERPSVRSRVTRQNKEPR